MIPIKGCKYIVCEDSIPIEYRPNKGWSNPVVYMGKAVGDYAKEYLFDFGPYTQGWAKAPNIKAVEIDPKIMTRKDIDNYILSLMNDKR